MKTCPRCNLAHNKIGIYCSRKCANVRHHSESTKQRIAESVKRFAIMHPKHFNADTTHATAARLGISVEEYLHRKTTGQYKRKWRNLNGKCRNCYQPKPPQKILCDQCRMSYYKFYRPSCAFRFSISEYPNEFDVDELKQLGMYSASNRGNNLRGISRDHLYSVKDGFLNGIDPAIISHPANCALVPHTINNKKHARSSITYEELLRRIETFDARVVKSG